MLTLIDDCPQCGHETGAMGALGTRAHYRCRMCGWQWDEAINNAFDDMEEEA